MLRTELLFIFVTIIAADCIAQSNQSAFIYPDSTWMQYATPEQAGWSSKKIAEVKDFADSLGSDAIMLIYKGAVVTEWGHNAEVEFIASIYKSLFNSLYGIAIEKGEIDTSATLDELYIRAQPPLSEKEKKAKVVHLLSASSGVYRQGRGPDPGSAEPGEQWYYNGWDFNALGSIYEQETGKIVFKAIEKLIAKPIGMQDYEATWGHYFSQPWRSEHPSYNIWMSARDLARFGLLYLRNGRWKDEQIISANWIEASTKPKFRYVIGKEIPIHYGLLWWISANELSQYDAYFASGVGSQSVWVLPKLDIVFVHRASRDYNQGVYGLDVEEILLQLIEAKIDNSVSQPQFTPVNWSQ
ncbi:CubicO group peptidase, beta-lactamase class C family [Fodinibius roseus]|uniref:CubicO group peptidase, beta-lactamase class C family n=1 Tax=Fodinibius roseus TaxID=1194090 RepID=A0A1M5IT91_9BACT|nr:serine hydrolase [Fodinibius roseus]SHG31527.1 CubicO group peptidase, beta-lactamase class C family [Fodinibius roseus]